MRRLRTEERISLDLSPFQSRELVERAAALLRRIAPKEELRFMHVCGTHENVVTRYGIRSLLPPQIRVVAGPGCPVCVTCPAEIDSAIQIARKHATLFTYGDMFGVPGSSISLRDARGEGARVKVVYSMADAIGMANPVAGPSVFFSIGFETTAPITASVIRSGVPKDFAFIVSHRLIPPALVALLDSGKVEMDGVICPGHVSTIIGTHPYDVLAKEFGVPVVISGFEPLDIVLSLVELVKQHKRGARVFNEYSRSVKPEGNPRARRLIDEVFETCDMDWRGIGTLPSSGLRLREEFSDLDALKKYRIRVRRDDRMPTGCKCSDVLLGSLSPTQCPLFGSRCTPDSPVGPCMVSSEGTCRTWFLHGGQDS